MALGIFIAYCGSFIMGYLAAIAISEEFMLWFKESLTISVGLFVIGVLQHFFSFGLMGIFAGIILGIKVPTKWLMTSIICYLTVWLYFIIEWRIIRGFFEPLITTNTPWWQLMPISILPICLFMASYIVANRYNQGVK